MTTRAALRQESPMQFIKATGLYRKSGEEQRATKFVRVNGSKLILFVFPRVDALSARTYNYGWP
jgi:hypothetical protein